MSFYAVLLALRDRLAAETSATVAAAQLHYGRAAAGPELTKGKWKAGAGIPALRIHGIDEDAVDDGADRAALGASLPVARRMVEVRLSVPLDANHVEKLEALTDALVADLHKAPVAGVKRIWYAGLRDPVDDEGTTENHTERTVAFWVTYPR